MHVAFASEKIFSIGSIDITNSLFSSLFIVLFIIIMALIIGSKLRYDNPGKLQIFLEFFVGFFYQTASDILGPEKARRFFSFLFSFFVIILVSNWFGLLPFVPSIVIKGEEHIETEHAELVTQASAMEITENKEIIQDQVQTTEEHEYVDSSTLEVEHKEDAVAEEKVLDFGYCLSSKECLLTTNGIETFEHGVHLFRAPTSDLSFTVALALISVVITNVLGLYFLKLGYLKKYFNFSSVINFVVGILELVSEFSKIISFSFRLFGNIFAGELVLVVITSLTFGIATYPFLLMELFVGIIQGVVFFMLTTVFINLAISHH